MLRNLVLLGILALALAGCGDSADPAGPGQGVPIFSLNAVPPEITPPENTQLYLTPQLPLDFEALDGEAVLFRSVSPLGQFSVLENLSFIDVDAPSGLNPAVWYAFQGNESTVDTIYAHVVTINGDTLAWNFCQVTIAANP